MNNNSLDKNIYLQALKKLTDNHTLGYTQEFTGSGIKVFMKNSSQASGMYYSCYIGQTK